MKHYNLYEEFSEEFANLIERLRYVPDSEDLEAEDLINQITAMQALNPGYSERFLVLADKHELITLMEIGFCPDLIDGGGNYYIAEDSYFETYGY